MSFKSKIVKSVLFITMTSITTAYAFMSQPNISTTQPKTSYQLISVNFEQHKPLFQRVIINSLSTFYLKTRPKTTVKSLTVLMMRM